MLVLDQNFSLSIFSLRFSWPVRWYLNHGFLCIKVSWTFLPVHRFNNPLLPVITLIADFILWNIQEQLTFDVFCSLWLGPRLAFVERCRSYMKSNLMIFLVVLTPRRWLMFEIYFWPEWLMICVGRWAEVNLRLWNLSAILTIYLNLGLTHNLMYRWSPLHTFHVWTLDNIKTDFGLDIFELCLFDKPQPGLFELFLTLGMIRRVIFLIYITLFSVLRWDDKITSSFPQWFFIQSHLNRVTRVILLTFIVRQELVIQLFFSVFWQEVLVRLVGRTKTTALFVLTNIYIFCTLSLSCHLLKYYY